MDYIKSNTPFSFNYTAYDQLTTLPVAGLVYDITGGVPLLLATVPMSNIANGCYAGNYTVSTGGTFLVVYAVFTDDTYTVIDTDRSAGATCFQVLQSVAPSWSFNYVDANQNNSLSIAANVYDLTTGSPIFVQKIDLVSVIAGAYFGTFIGQPEHTYEISSFVYTDGSYATIDPNYSPTTDNFFAITLQLNVVSSGGADLIAGPYSAVLKAIDYSALLRG